MLVQAWPSVSQSDGQVQETDFHLTLAFAMLVLIYVAEETHNQWFQEGQDFIPSNRGRKHHESIFG